jgi:hypothetical protein
MNLVFIKVKIPDGIKIVSGKPETKIVLCKWSVSGGKYLNIKNSYLT